MFTKKIFNIVTVFSILLLVACSDASGGSSETGKDTGIGLNEIRLGIDAGITTLPFRTAVDKGYFNENGLEPSIASFAYGIDTINALFTEQTDTGIAADYALLNSLGKGDLVILGTILRSDEESSKEQQLLIKGENIKSGKDLKGKKLGVAKGTVYEYIWAKYLELNKIDEKDVIYIPYSSPDEAIIGVKNGDIDAVWSSGSLTDKFKGIEGVKQIDDLNGAGVSIDIYLIAQRSYVEQNPTSVENALKAIKKGIDFTQNNKEEAAKIAFNQLKLPEEDALKDLERSNYVLGFTKEDVDHLKDMKQWLENNGKLTDKYNLEDKIMVEPLKRAVPDSVTYE
jgi:sulfonate transport system substrate-binding protein